MRSMIERNGTAFRRNTSKRNQFTRTVLLILMLSIITAYLLGMLSGIFAFCFVSLFMLVFISRLNSILFAIQNSEVVDIKMFNFNFSYSLALILLATFGLGVLVSLLLILPSSLKRSIEIGSLKRKLKKLEGEVERKELEKEDVQQQIENVQHERTALIEENSKIKKNIDKKI